MFSSKWWQVLSSLWLEFWLPLPLLGLIFWLGGSAMMDGILSRPFTTANTLKLLADPPNQINLSLASLSITATIDKPEGVTKVEIISIAPAKKVKFVLPITETEEIETAIAQKVGLSRQDVRKLTRYVVISSSQNLK
jgi:hypothetical protein